MAIISEKVLRIGLLFILFSNLMKTLNIYSQIYPTCFLFTPINLNFFEGNRRDSCLVEMEKRYLTSSTVDEHLEINNMHRAYLEELIKRNPKNMKALIQLGVLYWEPFHEQQKALKCFEKAITHNPLDIDAFFWAAKCMYHDFCAYEEAKEILKLALTINPRRADCLDLLATIIEDFDSNDKEALEYVKKAVKYAPHWPATRAFLVSLYIETHDLSAAERELKKLEELCKIPLIKPKNAIEDYYENIVTGRGSKRMVERIKALKERIQEAKVKNLKNRLL